MQSKTAPCGAPHRRIVRTLVRLTKRVPQDERRIYARNSMIINDLYTNRERCPPEPKNGPTVSMAGTLEKRVLAIANVAGAISRRGGIGLFVVRFATSRTTCVMSFLIECLSLRKEPTFGFIDSRPDLGRGREFHRIF